MSDSHAASVPTTITGHSPDGSGVTPVRPVRVHARPTRRVPTGMRFPVVHTVVAGDEYDGVRIYGQRLASTRAAMGRPTRTSCIGELASRSSLSHMIAGCDVVHLHLNDRLVDARPTDWERLVRAAQAASVPVIVTLHDVATDAETENVDDARARRRAVAMRRLARFGRCVIVSSRHEQHAAARIGITAHVVPHPIFSPCGGRDLAEYPLERSIVVAGFVHPGKGVSEFVRALGDVRGSSLDGWQLRLVGGVTDMHHDHLRNLIVAIERAGLDAHFTGPLHDRDWRRELARAGIPVACHAHCSASGSLLSWIAHGRRPFSSDHPFARELDRDERGSIDIVGDRAQWRSVIENAVANGDGRSTDPTGRRTPEASVDVFESIIGSVLGAAVPA